MIVVLNAYALIDIRKFCLETATLLSVDVDNVLHIAELLEKHILR